MDVGNRIVQIGRNLRSADPGLDKHVVARSVEMIEETRRLPDASRYAQKPPRTPGKGAVVKAGGSKNSRTPLSAINENTRRSKERQMVSNQKQDHEGNQEEVSEMQELLQKEIHRRKEAEKEVQNLKIRLALFTQTEAGGTEDIVSHNMLEEEPQHKKKLEEDWHGLKRNRSQVSQWDLEAEQENTPPGEVSKTNPVAEAATFYDDEAPLADSSKPRRPTRRWTLDQEAAFHRGYARYQKNWTKYLMDKELAPFFAGRTNVDLKDKHRTFERRARRACLNC